ncbi:MAG: class I SAM-dependent methyltransferase [Methanobrevibacter sp.]|nr:class I SAM-dependent methyltransferase [Candidatus Methanoflexus mossambicus]
MSENNNSFSKENIMKYKSKYISEDDEYYSKISKNVKIKIASSLTANKSEILSYLPYLLQDLWELGSSPEDMIYLIKKNIEIDSNTKILDLACGKGAISINLSKELNIKIRGIDIIPEFIEYAKKKAIINGVENKCSFEIEDINKSVENKKDYDIVIFGAVEDVLGTPNETLNKLKQTIKDDGYILIDEAYIKNKKEIKYDAYEYFTLNEWKEIFKKNNLHLIETLKSDINLQKEINEYNTKKIEKRAKELKEKYPDKKDLFDEYIENQKAESEDLEDNLIGVTWLLKKKNLKH